MAEYPSTHTHTHTILLGNSPRMRSGVGNVTYTWSPIRPRILLPQVCQHYNSVTIAPAKLPVLSKPVSAHNELIVKGCRLNTEYITEIIAYLPDSKKRELSRLGSSEAQVGRLKGPKPVSYSTICRGAPLMNVG